MTRKPGPGSQTENYYYPQVHHHPRVLYAQSGVKTLDHIQVITFTNLDTDLSPYVHMYD